MIEREMSVRGRRHDSDGRANRGGEWARAIPAEATAPRSSVDHSGLVFDPLWLWWRWRNRFGPFPELRCAGRRTYGGRDRPERVSHEGELAGSIPHIKKSGAAAVPAKKPPYFSGTAGFPESLRGFIVGA